jgi:hypothetical protein
MNQPRTAILVGINGLVLATVLVALAGCGKPATAITGTVTLDGQPLPKATLEFFPVSGRGKVSFANADERGRYRADVSPSKLTVVITATKVVGKMKNSLAPDGPLVDKYGSAIPERYSYREQTPLTADPVEDKTTTIDFAITSSGK